MVQNGLLVLIEMLQSLGEPDQPHMLGIPLTPKCWSLYQVNFPIKYVLLYQNIDTIVDITSTKIYLRMPDIL